mmetsp:Transcript_37442/g.67690  ORF Transcript_37442/g.67690 Transcript_37442/m.67690 type:complete len:212 (+) Transcript_37442:246-881(+)
MKLKSGADQRFLWHFYKLQGSGFTIASLSDDRMMSDFQGIDESLIVGRDQHYPCMLLEAISQGRHGNTVQVVRGLIHQQHIRRRCCKNGKGNSCLLPTAEIAYPGFVHIGLQAQSSQGLSGKLHGFCRCLDIFNGIAIWREVCSQILGEQINPSRVPSVCLPNHALALDWVHRAVEIPQQCGLASSIWTNESYPVARPQLQLDAGNDGLIY